MSTGSCLCGNIKYGYTGTPALVALCHCLDCQCWGGSSSSSNVVVLKDAFKILQGVPKKYICLGASGKEHPLFYLSKLRYLAVRPAGSYARPYSINADTLDGDANNFDVGIEFYTKDRRTYENALQGVKQAVTMSQDQAYENCLVL